MRSFEQYDEICKYFAEGKQRDNDTNEIRKYLQLYNLSLGEYLVNKYALWLDFRTIDENELRGTGRRIENASEGITLQIEKKEESSGALNTSQCNLKTDLNRAKVGHSSDMIFVSLAMLFNKKSKL